MSKHSMLHMPEDSPTSLKGSEMNSGSANAQHRSSVVLLQEGAEVTMIPTSTEIPTAVTHDNVYVTPTFMEFTDASEGVTCRQKITLRNSGSKPAYVKIRDPNSIAFQVKALKTGVMLNPGLSVSTWVTYSFKRPSLLRAMIPIEINGTILDYQVICTLTTERIGVEPTSIDFGTIDIGYSSGLKIITLTNEGGKSTRFSVDLGANELEITVKPLRGIVRPHAAVRLKVELIGLHEGLYYSEFWIKSVPNVRVPLKVNIIVPRLVVYHPNATGDFTLIDFQPTVENTSRYETFVLRNLSSQVSSYIVLGEVNNELLCIRDIDHKKYPVYSAFKIRPIEGRMDAFEGIIFEVGFSPTTKLMHWRRKMEQETSQKHVIDSENPANDFMAFLRIVRVHCTESEDILRVDPVKEVTDDALCQQKSPLQEALMELTGSSSSSRISSIDSGPHDTVKLCLHGEVEFARAKFEPDILYFGDLHVGEISRRVVRIMNISKFAVVTFKFVRNGNARCRPEQITLEPEKSFEVLIEVRGKESVPPKFNLVFETIVDSYESSPSRRKTRVKIGRYFVECQVKVLLTTKPPSAGKDLSCSKKSLIEKTCNTTMELNTNTERLCQIISTTEYHPRKLHELKTFICDRLVLDSTPIGLDELHKFYRMYITHFVNTNESDTISNVWEANRPEALSIEEAIFKAYHRLYWDTYLKFIPGRAERAIRERIDDDDDVMARILRFPKWTHKAWTTLPACSLLPAELSLSRAKAEVLVPLSPLQIYNVHISPTILAFGMVALRTRSYQALIVENRNDFPVMVRLISLSSRSIHFPEGNMLILQAGSVVTRLVEFYADHIGKYNGYLDYIINDNHSFELSITADVVYKQLSVDKREIILGNDSVPGEAYKSMTDVIQIKNKLDTRTSFVWEIPFSSNFVIQPMAGTIRGNGIMYAHVSYVPDSAKANDAEVILKCESGSYITIRLRVSITAPKVNFINEAINLGDIPLNLPTRAVAVLHNTERNEVMFEIEKNMLLRGCDAHPLRGKIPPRGIYILELEFTIDVCLKFTTSLVVSIDKVLQILLRLSGSVLFPKLKLSPQNINMRRISADAFQTHPLTFTNIGTTAMKLNFVLSEYPEFRISSTTTRKSPHIGTNSIIIIPELSQTMYLHFLPVDLASYAFYLPVVINDLLGPPLVTNLRSLQPWEYTKRYEEFYINEPGVSLTEMPPKLPVISIDCTVAGHVVFFNKLLFQFNAYTDEIQEELIIENSETHRETTVLLRTDAFEEHDCPFSIKWSHGVKPTVLPTSIVFTLQPGEGTTFILEFHPTQYGTFTLSGPIFVRGELDGNMFNKLRLDGENLPKNIESDVSEIYFSPVPLNTMLEEKLQLHAWRFRNPSTVNWKLQWPVKYSGEFVSETIDACFPLGNEVPASSHTELDVLVRFKTQWPVSFCAVLHFYDEEEEVMCPVTIYGTADNNILTTHAYMKLSGDSRKQRNLDKRLSYPTVKSPVNGNAEEDIDDNQLLGKKQRDSGPRLSVHSYLDRSSRSSALKMADLKLLQGKEDTDSFDDLLEEDDQIDFDFEAQLRSRKRGSVYSVESPSKHRRSSSKLMYPHYPLHRHSEYERHMVRTMKAAEQWLYSSVFKYTFYPSVPDGITASFSNFLQMKKPRGRESKNKTCLFPWSYLEVLESLIGSDIYEHLKIPCQPLPDDDSERIGYVLQIYDKIIGFLLNQGACLAHVTSLYLLSHSDYRLTGHPVQYIPYRKILKDTEAMPCDQLSKQAFESRSKQCWLDIILQTYKCLVMRRICEATMRKNMDSISLSGSRRSTIQRESTLSSLSSLSKNLDIHEKAMNEISRMSKKLSTKSHHSEEEFFLLSWLQYHYDQQRTQEWMTDRRVILNPKETRDIANERDIDNFDEDLSDSLVLIAVTGAFCPFLINEYFSNIIICPRSTEEGLHNAICIVTAWNAIRLGFIILPIEIAHPNNVQMLMLVSHLFQVLPTYVPRCKIKFSASLTSSIVRQISFSNPTENSTEYLVFFLDNDNGFFELAQPQDIFRVNSHDNCQLKIRFYAKKIRKTKAYLLCCGTAIGPHFGRNQVFVLEGRAENLAITNEHIIKSKLYQVLDKTLPINVPYDGATEYEIWMTEEKPSKPTTLRITRWSELRTRKIPRRLFLNEKSIIVTQGQKVAYLLITIACISPDTRSFWLIFQSKLGDFITQITSHAQTSLTDRILVEGTNEATECVCSNPQNEINDICPFAVNIPIPSRNSQLWNCISVMFQKTLDPKERTFWSRYLDTYIGLRLIHWLMGDSTDSAAMEFAHIFNMSVTYTVTISDKLNFLSVPETFVIQDVRPPDKQVMMIGHVSSNAPPVYEVMITLTSQDGKELRIYMVNIVQALKSQ